MSGLCLISECMNKAVRHHVRSKGAGGTDDDYNIMPLCDDHHTHGGDCIHKGGRTTFVNKHPEVKLWMIKNGWELCELSNKWYRLNPCETKLEYDGE